MFRSVLDHPKGDLICCTAVQQQPGLGGYAESTQKHKKYNRHASTNLKILSLVTDVKKINKSLRMVKN